MKTKIIIALIIISTLFAWGQSMIPIPQSEQESVTIKELVEEVINTLSHASEGEGVELPLALIRKTAHFVEYFVIGAEWMALFLDKNNRKWWYALLIGFFTGFIDETIQLFSGRGSLIGDVYLDSFGAFCGIMITFWILTRCFNKKPKSL